MNENEVLPQPETAEDRIQREERRWRAKRIERYLRETRNATRFIAWVVGIWAALTLIVGIIVAVQLARMGTPACDPQFSVC